MNNKYDHKQNLILGSHIYDEISYSNIITNISILDNEVLISCDITIIGTKIPFVFSITDIIKIPSKL